MTSLGIGLHDGIAHADYLAMPALGSTHLSWLSVSPHYYQWMLTHPEEPTASMSLGTALHMATLEPERFEQTYVQEPDPQVIAPGYSSPRSTKVYKESVAHLEALGRTVLRAEQMESVRMMAAGLRTHAKTSAVLERAPRREVTALFDVDGRRCRARFDALGDGVIADVKTTRSLRNFSPHTVTEMGYAVQGALYVAGARALGLKVSHFFFAVVENVPPYDVGCFVLDDECLDYGMNEAARLLALLGECERTDNWPGQFPEIERAMVTERALQVALEGEEVA